ncbi:hypothetical protein HW555_000459 [Spodoptera exigua]|uniref:Uncharacterized protein n=1 Tax=Spodoptera exigua TaxID=7107 RepID=A0A835GTP7_SPOEX|nr:hypothetical protein HW555_000459 [Spodoptera exigua]
MQLWIVEFHDDSQQHIQVTHEVEVHTTMTDYAKNSVNLQQMKCRRKLVMRQQNSNFDDIETYVEPDTNSTKQPSPLLNLTPVKLTDILVIPKTPQRKGVKTIKRTPFVLTSKKWRSLENEKIRIKQEKEEGVKRRKEEREKKKLEAKQAQPKVTKTKKKRVHTEKENTGKKENTEKINDNTEKKKENNEKKKETTEKKKETTETKKEATENKENTEKANKAKLSPDTIIDITLKPPKSVKESCYADENKKENYPKFADAIIDSNKVLYTDAEIEKFLTEFEG